MATSIGKGDAASAQKPSSTANPGISSAGATPKRRNKARVNNNCTVIANTLIARSMFA